MASPLMSVVMPAHNTAPFISESIESVIAQTIQDWELIIVDGASTDRTSEIASEYQRLDRRIKLVVPELDDGVARARNVGLDHAKGSFIAFIDSDDIWHPEKTAMQIGALERTKADISYTSYWRVYETGKHRKLVTVPERITYAQMLRRDLIGTSTAIIRSSSCGGFRMPLLRVAEDHAYWLSLLRDGTRTTVGLNDPLVEYRVRHDSLSANKLTSARYAWKLRREVEGFTVCKSLWLFAGYAFDALRLRLIPNKRTWRR